MKMIRVMDGENRVPVHKKHVCKKTNVFLNFLTLESTPPFAGPKKVSFFIRKVISNERHFERPFFFRF